MEDNELILQGAPALDIEVTPDDIDNEIENYLLSSIGDSGNSSPNFIDVESLYEDWLERIRLSEEEYERLVEADLLRGNITDHLRITEVPEETEQVHLHIIFVDDETSASLVSELLRDGGNFTDLAEEFSTIDELKDAKGDAGWVPRGIYPDLDNVIFSIEIGNVTEPIPATQGGYYIVKVTEKEDNVSVPEDYKDILAARAFEDWILDQRAASIIEEYLNRDDVLWAIDQIT
jgi:parvulin-like peptidyl-prolyl isomerase